MLVPSSYHRVIRISFPVTSKNCNSAPLTWHHQSAVLALTVTIVTFDTLHSYFDIHSCVETDERTVCAQKEAVIVI